MSEFESTPNTNDDINYDNAQLWFHAGFEIIPLDKQLVPAMDVETWKSVANKANHFSDHPEHSVGWILPTGYFAIVNDTAADRKAQTDTLKAIGKPPNFSVNLGDIRFTVFRGFEPGLVRALLYRLPQGVSLRDEGQAIPLPDYSEHTANEWRAKTPAEITIMLLDDLQPDQPTPDTAPPVPQVVVEGTPLEKHSLRGMADHFEKLGVRAEPLLGDVCLSGQSTVWYAPPNSGKTLIGLHLALEAISAGRVNAENLYYINADDNSSGLAAKLHILDDVGAHTLVPGFNGFNAYHLRQMMVEMSQTDKARGVVLIIDTIKKFVSLMDKKESSAFANACRMLVMRGGTVLAFAHTNKNPGPDGQLRYAGTTDLVEDFDAAYVLTPFEVEQQSSEKVVYFECIKARGDRPEAAAYAYSTENGLTYAELLASVEPVQFDRLGQIKRDLVERSDMELIEAVKVCIADGINTKMDLAKEVARRTKTSGKGAIKLIDRYTGDDHDRHYWTFTVGERGKHLFVLLTPGAPAN